MAAMIPYVCTFLKKAILRVSAAVKLSPFFSVAARMFTFLSAAALLISYCFPGMAHIRVWLRLSLCFFLFALLYMQSNEGLTLIFIHRGVVQPETRRKIAAYAKRTVFVLYAAFLLLLNLKSIVILVIKAVGAGVRCFAEFLAWLIGLLHTKPGQYAEVFGFMPFDPRPSPSPLAVFILHFTAYSLVLFSLYIIMPLVWGKLKDCYARLIAKIAALFARKERFASDEAEEYTDTVETVRKLKAGKPPPKEEPGIPGLVEALGASSDTALKIRLMYAIIIKTLLKYGLPLKKSDTTWEIAEKAGCINGIGSCLNTLTTLYNNVRYGSMVTHANDLPEAESCFNTVYEGLEFGRTMGQERPLG